MNDHNHGSHEALEAALDRALRRSFKAPGLPPGFREQLRAAIVRSGEVDHAALRHQLEREEREALREMRAGYVRVRRQAMFTMLLAAFVGGAAATWALPLLAQVIGPRPAALMAALGAVAGIVVAVGYSLRSQWQPLVDRVVRWVA